MSDPVDHSVRSLAEILREHGLESEAGTRPGTSGPPTGGRRRTTADKARPGASKLPVSGGDRRTAERRTAGRRVEDQAAPAAAGVTPAAVPRFGRRKTDVDLPEPVAPGQGVLFESGPTTAAIPGLRPSRTPGVPGGPGSRSGEPDLASTGRIPKVVLPAQGEQEPLTGKQSALAWVRFAAEMVAAVGVGIGVYYLFTVLWELLPYVAAVAAPVVVTGLVGAVAAWRAKTKQPPLETRVLLVLLFAGTLLAVVPAAGLLTST